MKWIKLSVFARRVLNKKTGKPGVSRNCVYGWIEWGRLQTAQPGPAWKKVGCLFFIREDATVIPAKNGRPKKSLT